jgi:hypothetical protein
VGGVSDLGLDGAVGADRECLAAVGLDGVAGRGERVLVAADDRYRGAVRRCSAELGLVDVELT